MEQERKERKLGLFKNKGVYMSDPNKRFRDREQGTWKLANGSPVWEKVTWTEEFDPILNKWRRMDEKKIELLTPQQLGYVKKAVVKVIFPYKVPSMTKYKGWEISWFLEEITVKVREDQHFIWLLWNESNGSLHHKNVMFAWSGKADIGKSNNITIVTRKEPQHISLKEKQKLEKEPHVIVISDPESRKDDLRDSGRVLYGQRV